MRRLFRCVSTLAAAFVLASGSVGLIAEQHHYSEQAQQAIQAYWDPKREEWQKPEEVIQKLNLRAGDTVADLGCGPGYFTLRLARAVGPTGKVYAVDIHREVLDYVAQLAKEAHLQNITTIVADPHNPKLPRASLDMVFLCNTLHWIKDRTTYYPLPLKALKAHGRVVDIDWKRTNREAMTQELTTAGFRLVRSWDLLADQHFLVFED